MTAGQWIKLGTLWTRIELEQDSVIYLRVDDRALQECGLTFDQALEILQTANDTGQPLPSSERAHDAYQVLAIRAHPERNVIRIKTEWIRSA